MPVSRTPRSQPRLNALAISNTRRIPAAAARNSNTTSSSLLLVAPVHTTIQHPQIVATQAIITPPVRHLFQKNIISPKPQRLDAKLVVKHLTDALELLETAAQQNQNASEDHTTQTRQYSSAPQFPQPVLMAPDYAADRDRREVDDEDWIHEFIHLPTPINTGATPPTEPASSSPFIDYDSSPDYDYTNNYYYGEEDEEVEVEDCSTAASSSYTNSPADQYLSIQPSSGALQPSSSSGPAPTTTSSISDTSSPLISTMNYTQPIHDWIDTSHLKSRFPNQDEEDDIDIVYMMEDEQSMMWLGHGHGPFGIGIGGAGPRSSLPPHQHEFMILS